MGFMRVSWSDYKMGRTSGSVETAKLDPFMNIGNFGASRFLLWNEVQASAGFILVPAGVSLAGPRVGKEVTRRRRRRRQQ